jgi:hypothetical protein
MATHNQKVALEEVTAEMAVPQISASAHDALQSLRTHDEAPISGRLVHANEHRFCHNPNCGAEIVILTVSGLKDQANWRCACGSDMDSTDTRRQAAIDQVNYLAASPKQMMFCLRMLSSLICQHNQPLTFSGWLRLPSLQHIRRATYGQLLIVIKSELWVTPSLEGGVLTHHIEQLCQSQSETEAAGYRIITW